MSQREHSSTFFFLLAMGGGSLATAICSTLCDRVGLVQRGHASKTVPRAARYTQRLPIDSADRALVVSRHAWWARKPILPHPRSAEYVRHAKSNFLLSEYCGFRVTRTLRIPRLSLPEGRGLRSRFAGPERRAVRASSCRGNYQQLGNYHTVY
jgi:hypothetical protein